MADTSIPLQIAQELKASPNVRRHRLVDNIVAAGEALRSEDKKISPPCVSRKVSSLGLKGGPAAQTIYNTPELKTLVEAFSSTVQLPKVPDRSKRAFGSDEEEVLSCLDGPRLKSMFRDIVHERDKLKQQMRILDANLKRLSEKAADVTKIESNPVPRISKSDQLDETKAAVNELIKALDEYSFELRGDDIVKGARPIGAKRFVQLARHRGWLD